MLEIFLFMLYESDEMNALKNVWNVGNMLNNLNEL
jgi:hypothetical protein